MVSKGRGGKLVVATDSKGRVVAAAHVVEGGEITTGLEALDGQTVHELAIPPELKSMTSSHALLASLAHARVSPGGELRLRTIHERSPEQ